VLDLHGAPGGESGSAPCGRKKQRAMALGTMEIQ
jgi:hypothetical protein